MFSDMDSEKALKFNVIYCYGLRDWCIFFSTVIFANLKLLLIVLNIF